MAKRSFVWVSEIDPLHASGGGEQIQRRVIRALEEEGHHVDVYTTQSYIGRLYRSGYDVVVLADVWNEPGIGGREKLPKKELLHLIRHARYITWDCGYSTVCGKDYLPCCGRWHVCGRCEAKVDRDVLHEFYGRAMLNVFLSPLQARTIRRLVRLPCWQPYCYFPAVDSLWLEDNDPVPRDLGLAYVGVVCAAKGAGLLLRAARWLESGGSQCHARYRRLVGALKSGPVRVYGVSRDVSLPWPPSRAVPPRDLRAALLRHKFVFAMPLWPEPFGLYAAEASLAGAKLLFNDRVGALSYKLDLSCKELYEWSLRTLCQALADLPGTHISYRWLSWWRRARQIAPNMELSSSDMAVY